MTNKYNSCWVSSFIYLHDCFFCYNIIFIFVITLLNFLWLRLIPPIFSFTKLIKFLFLRQFLIYNWRLFLHLKVFHVQDCNILVIYIVLSLSSFDLSADFIWFLIVSHKAIKQSFLESCLFFIEYCIIKQPKYQL